LRTNTVEAALSRLIIRLRSILDEGAATTEPRLPSTASTEEDS
jgi:hypothetical protein